MGVVYRAHDQLIDRSVALKLVATTAHEHLEPASLGRLSHPGIVRIYDAGRHQHMTFMAMELIAGATLDGWLATSPSYARLIAVFARLMDALAYAHAQGVVHGDITPRNVLIDAQDAPHIIDFGLAVREHQPSHRGGTPGYIAPEVQAGAPVTPAADQYAVAVMLARVATALPRLRAIVARGTQPTPVARFASMSDMRTSLLALRRPRWRPVGFALLPAVAVLGVAVFARTSPTPPPTCTAPGLSLTAPIQAALALARLPAPANAVTRFNAWQTRLASERDANCMPVGTPPTSASACLASLASRMEARIAAIHRGNADPAALLALLDAPAACARAAPAHSLAQAPAVQAVAAELERLELAVEYVDSAQLQRDAQAAVTQATTIGHAPLLAATHYTHGLVRERMGDFLGAQGPLSAAVEAATRGRDQHTLALALLETAVVERNLGATSKVADALRLARAAASSLEPSVMLKIELYAAVVQIHAGDAMRALPSLQALLATCDALPTPQPLLCIDIHQAQLATLFDARRFDDARHALPALEARLLSTVGRHNQRYAIFLANQIGLGNNAASQAHAEMARAIFTAISPTHPKLVPLLQNMAMLAENRHDGATALRLLGEALTLARTRHGPHSRAVAHLDVNLATRFVNNNQAANATPLLTHAIGVLANAEGGARSPYLAAARSMHAELLLDEAKWQAAYDVLVPLVASQLRPEADPTARGRDQAMLAKAAHQLGNIEEALRALDGAIADLSASGGAPQTLREAKQLRNSIAPGRSQD